MVQIVKGTVDTQKNNCQSIGRANAGDDLKLELEIQMNGQPITFVNPTFELLIKKADNNKVRQTKDIIYQDGKIKIKVDQQGVTCPGTVINQLIINDEGKISTCLFYFTVGASLEKEILQSISKVETLEQLDSYVVAAFSNLDEYEKRLTLLDSTMTTTNEEITANESERKSNESERKDNETLRIENEKERVKKENEMSAAEIDRKENELDRIKNENARRIAENTRIARENARENAEINRNAIFEENEAIRTEAEKLRVQAEIKRKESFSNLESLNEKLNAAEENRVNSEEDRISKETERQLAEAERERAEANREKTYTSFNNAEVDRKNSEDARIQAEASRVQAENARSEQFEAAQSARETKFQEVENNRDKLFKANETARATEEIARKKAESTREGNETIRVNSESLRVAAEKARQQEEIKRGQAEVARVEAEKSRELSYEAIKKDNSTFKQQMNEDFGNAKTDYFGKEHLNVVDRLNNDFDNVHQKINNASYLEYSGSNIKADNSYYGYTKEMSIKGKTLQNICPKNYEISWQHTGTWQSTFLYDNSATASKKTLIDVKPNTKYTIIINVTENTSNVDVLLNNAEQSNSLVPTRLIIPKGTTGLLKYVITTINDFSILDHKIFLRAQSNGAKEGVTRVSNVIILEGDYTTTPIEELPFIEGIKSVGENEDNLIKIKTFNKNLFSTQLPNIKSNGVTLEIKDNKYVVSSSATSPSYPCVSYKLPIKYLLGKKVRFSCNIEYSGDIKPAFICSYKRIDGSYNYVTVFNDSTVYTFPNVCESTELTMNLTVNNKGNTGVVGSATFSQVMVQIDNTDTMYVDGKLIQQELQLTEPLRSLPNGVCDEILENGTEIRRIGKAVFDGSDDEKWHINIHNENITNRFRIQLASNSTQFSKPAGWCDTLPFYPNREWAKDVELIEMDLLRLSIRKPFNTVEEFKAYLKANPVTIYYELAEPVITKHNKSINLKTYDGTTHITSDNYLQPKLSCKVPSNVQAVVSGLKEENKVLNTQVSTLNLENEEIKETNTIQDELIDTTMMATDQMYMMLEPLLANILVDGEAISPLVNMYAAMVQRGLKTIEQVPTKWRAQVEEILSESNE